MPLPDTRVEETITTITIIMGILTTKIATRRRKANCGVTSVKAKATIKWKIVQTMILIIRKIRKIVIKIIRIIRIIMIRNFLLGSLLLLLMERKP